MRRCLVPIHRLFPVWRFGHRHNIFGDPLPDGWYPDWYRYGEITEAQAQRIMAGEKPDMSWFAAAEGRA